jgi:hypothetical protein
VELSTEHGVCTPGLSLRATQRMQFQESNCGEEMSLVKGVAKTGRRHAMSPTEDHDVTLPFEQQP